MKFLASSLDGLRWWPPLLVAFALFIMAAIEKFVILLLEAGLVLTEAASRELLRPEAAVTRLGEIIYMG